MGVKQQKQLSGPTISCYDEYLITGECLAIVPRETRSIPTVSLEFSTAVEQSPSGVTAALAFTRNDGCCKWTC